MPVEKIMYTWRKKEKLEDKQKNSKSYPVVTEAMLLVTPYMLVIFCFIYNISLLHFLYN